MFSPEFIQEMKQKLQERQAELLEELKNLHPHTEMGDDEDGNAQEVEIDEVNQDLIARMNSDLKKIEIALSKIEQGNYGLDEDGNAISEDRLRAIPWADKAI